MDRDRRKSTSDKAKYNKSTHEWEEEDLDEEMEDIFHPANDHFSVSDFAEREVEAKPQFDEQDFDRHRKENLQYHQPLHRLYQKHKKPRRSDNHSEEYPRISTVNEEPLLDPSSEREPNEDEPLLDQSIKKTESDPNQIADSDDKLFYVGSASSLESTAQQSAKKPLKSVLRAFSNKDGTSSSDISPPFHSPSSLKKSSEEALSSADIEQSQEKIVDASRNTSSTFDKEKSKVTFLLGQESQNDLQKDVPDVVNFNHTNRHTRRRSVKRKHHGFNIDAKPYKTVLEPEEAETLQTADIDDMASHRFEDPKGIRRSKIKDKFFPTFFKRDIGKKKVDRTPHELFVELHELLEDEDTSDLEWRQTARWIKYEEDVELGPDRWGKPHVPPLCFHSLVKLRQCIEAGAVQLDVNADNIVDIINEVVHSMFVTDQISSDLKSIVSDTLMRQHRHVNEKHHSLMRRNSAGYGNLNLLGTEKSRSALFSKSFRSKSLSDANHVLNNGENTAPAETSILMDSDETNDVEIISSSKRKSSAVEKVRIPDTGILRRVPANAEGVAVLVGQLPELERPASTFIRLAQGKNIPQFLEIPINVRFIYVLLGPQNSKINFHEIGRALGSLMSNEDFRVSMYQATCMKDILSGINKFLDSSTVVPPGKWEKACLLPIDEIRRKSLSAVQADKEPPKKPSYDPLKRTKKLFGGFIEDIKHRYPFYVSDILDGINFQCVASVIFIYFAAVSGAIAFGGLLSDKTDMNIGVSETLIGTAICGVFFSLFSGQPLIIIGTTGPLLLFDEMLYQLKEYYSSPFLVMRVWIGIWTAIIAILVVAFEGSILVKFFSRFVQEIFATIISLLFIVESLSKLYRIFKENPLLVNYCEFLNDTNSTVNTYAPTHPQPNTALLSAILMIGTFYIAYFLRHFRNSKFLGRSARTALGDFGVPIGIVIMVTIDYFIKDTYTQKLSVPEGLSPSTDRSWIISPVPIAVWEAFIAFIGGLLIFILLFMETQICEMIISKKQLQKGSGFHIDMILIGIMEMMSAFIGGPWQCAATVRSISHVSSLIVWSKTHAPGELPHIVEVKEQRLTNFLVSILVGMSVMMAPLLREVPLAVLFGVFLYMGISALSGIHLFERFLLIFMPSKHHPDFPFVRKVRTKKMHLYTAIQIVCIGILWAIKTYFSPAFPFGLLSMVFIHSQIKRLFTKEEIKALDGEEDEDIEDEPDFYKQIVA